MFENEIEIVFVVIADFTLASNNCPISAGISSPGDTFVFAKGL